MKVSSGINYSAGTAKRMLALAGALLLGTSAIALVAPPATASLNIFSNPQDKQARGRVPGRRRGGARRGTCAATTTQLVALVAAVEVETQTLPETYVGGITSAERPTFWFDVPYTLNDEITAEFVLQNNSGQDVYRTTSAEFAADYQTAGIIGISLPPEIPPLTIGETYEWYFKIDCGAESPLYVQGGIERTTLTPTLANQLSAASPLEQAELYQANDFWYDAVSAIAPLHLAQEEDPAISAAWSALMRSLGLLSADTDVEP